MESNPEQRPSCSEETEHSEGSDHSSGCTSDTGPSQSECSHQDDDPDYEPSDSDEDEDDDEDEYDEEEEGTISNSLIRKLVPLLMGGSPFQMPMMFVIKGNNDNDEEEDDDEDEDDEDEDEDAELDRELRRVEKDMEGRKRKRSEDDVDKLLTEYNREERSYIKKLPKEEKDRMLQADMRIRKMQMGITGNCPMRFKILDSPMDDGSKRIILSKLEQFQRMHEGSGEYFKLRNWLNAANRLPLGRIKPLPINADPESPADVDKVSEYLVGIRKALDETVYGHNEAKEQVLRILAQWISNPGSCGHCIGIQGPPGCGKTSLVKDGICKALNLPFSLISLGCYGSDGSALTGHHFTYEGATYGKISECLIKAQYMNPILYFDELDKISDTPKGAEVANVLIHLTDSTQNDHFSDSYFSEIPLDLSKCLIIFSYNDEGLINPILKDRMITIHVSGYSKKEKLEIAQNYLVPRLLKSYNLRPTDIVFDNSIIEEIIERVAPEEGVRNLKRGIDAIISWINMRRYVPNLAPSFSEKDKKDKEDADSPVKIELPVKITTQLVKKYLKRSEEGAMSRYLMSTMFT